MKTKSRTTTSCIIWRIKAAFLMVNVLLLIQLLQCIPKSNSLTVPQLCRYRYRRRPPSQTVFSVCAAASPSSSSAGQQKEPSAVDISSRQEQKEAKHDTDGDPKNKLIRYRGRVAYDGSKFQGFQIQLGKRNARSVQGTLEEVLQKRFNRDDIRVVGAGRTDAGVHARGQAFHFDLRPEEHAQLSSSSSSSSSSLKKDEMGQRQRPPLDYTMNRMLTDETRVWNVGPAPPPVEKVLSTHPQETRKFSWNAIHDTTMKLYSYRICVGPVMDPIWRHQRWQVPADGTTIDIALLKRVLSHFEGTHDFRPFAGAVEQLEKRTQRQLSTHRTIYKCELIDESDMYGGKDGGYYRIDVLLQGALYKMVRNMVGTTLEVSKGRMEESTFLKLLQGNKPDSADNENVVQIGRKNNPAKPAPPEGLTLERVYYEDDDIF